MNNTASQQTQTVSGLSIEDLLKAAFARTKERFLPYILTYILSVFIFIGVFIALFLLGGLNFLIWTIAKSSVVTGILGFISGIIGLLAFIYVGSWTGLAIIYSLVSPTKLGVLDVLKAVRPMVWSYVKVSIIVGTFMLGIFPFGILTIGILLLLWAIWGMFMVFVFLDKKETGLRTLFMSKAIVNTRFWGIFLRGLMIYAVYFFILYVLGMVQAQKGIGGLGGVLIFIFGILAGPFSTSYFYEIYKHLPHPKEVGSNGVWIGLSVLGWIINIALIVWLSTGAVQGAQNLMNSDLFKNGNFQKQLQMMEEDATLMEEDADSMEAEEFLRQMMDEELEQGTENEI